MAVIPNDALQPVGIEGVLKLLRVGGAHGGDEVRGVNGAFHQIYIPVVGEHLLIEVFPREAEKIFQRMVAVTALIFDIVDGKHRLGRGKLGHAVPFLQQVNGNQRRLPVVAVDNIRTPVQMARNFDYRAGKISKPFAVVIVAIYLGPLKVILVIHKPPGNAVPLKGVNPTVAAAPGELKIKALDKAHLVPPDFSDPLVKRENDSHLMPLGGQCRGQRAGHISQASDFDKGSGLGSSK
ncbi:hypothetical protein SDC9_137105 [bioreactor metagenome]|uniref:Uncharacterized protein n=1 Tax=bioreactor metagenome TaxID=1076179 RepID=A0A645DL22_9ZZZZ